MDNYVTEPMNLGTLVAIEKLRPSLKLRDSDGTLLGTLNPNLKREYFIGRGKEYEKGKMNDIIADEGRVSRKHGRIFYDTAWHYEDLLSLNGSILEDDEFIYRQDGIEIAPNPDQYFIIASGGIVKKLSKRKGSSVRLPAIPLLIGEPDAANIKHIYLGSKFDYGGALSSPEQGYKLVLEVIRS